MRYTTYKEALAQKEHLIALGETTIYIQLENEDDLPWHKICDIQPSASCRNGIPIGVCLIAEVQGLKFIWNVEFESRDKEGWTVHAFDTSKMDSLTARLNPHMRAKLSQVLTEYVLDEVIERTQETIKYMNHQIQTQALIMRTIEEGLK